MVFQQQLVACGPDVVSPLSTVTMRATFEDLHTRTSRSVELSQTVDALSRGSVKELHRAQAIVAYAELLKSAQASTAIKQAALAHARAAIAQARHEQDDGQLAEIDVLIERFAEGPVR